MKLSREKFEISTGFFAEALRALRRAIGSAEGIGEITQEEMAKRIGCKYGAYRQWERAKRVPRGDWLIKIMRLCPDAKSLSLFGIDPPRQVAPSSGIKADFQPPEIRVLTPTEWGHLRKEGDEEPEYDAIPLFLDPVAAGTPREVGDKNIEGWALIHHSLMQGHRAGNVICVRVEGNSMEPVLPNHGLAAVDITKHDAERKKPRMALIQIDGAVTVKLVRIVGEKLQITAYNEDAWPPLEIPTGKVKILGTVVWWWGRVK